LLQDVLLRQDGSIGVKPEQPTDALSHFSLQLSQLFQKELHLPYAIFYQATQMQFAASVLIVARFDHEARAVRSQIRCTQ
jgi:hypothetical protein